VPRIYGCCFCAHSICGEPRIQHNTSEKIATTSPSFYYELRRLHVLCVKAAPSTTFTSWSQHHFVAIGKPEQQVRKDLHCGSKQQ